MKRRARFYSLIIISLLSCTSPLKGNSLLKRTITRQVDPIIVKGEDLSKFLGKKVNSLYLYANRGQTSVETTRRVVSTDPVGSDPEKFVPIPFQIDRRDSQGDLIFPSSSVNPVRNQRFLNGVNSKSQISNSKNLNFGKDSNSYSLLSNNDELVFMAKDLGNRVLQKDWIEDAEEGLEIEVIDPLNGSKGWAYLFSFSSPKKKSSLDYVDYLPKENKIKAQRYIVGFCPQAEMVFDNLTITKTGGGDGVDIFDRFKVRVEARMFLGVRFSKNEEDFTSQVTGYLDGPVRVIRRSKSRTKVFGVFSTPWANSDFTAYCSFFKLPIIINLPFDLSLLLSKLSLRMSADASLITGRKFYNSNNLKGVELDGVMSKKEHKLDYGPAKWLVVAGTREGDTGTWLNRLLIPPSSGLIPNLYYQDDLEALDGPEEVPGQIGNIGYEITNFTHLKGGKYKIISIMYTLPKYKVGDEKGYLDVLDHPLKVVVKEGL